VTPATALPFGTALALAQRTLTAPLAAILDTEGLTMPQWFTLNALGLRGPAPIETLAALLATNGLDDAAAREAVATLETAGLVHTAAGLASLTAAGTARYAGLRDRIGRVSAYVAERFGAARTEAARALLQEIAETDPAELTSRTSPRRPAAG
jgi:DNA-binding MarR family transcriptional regulator